MRVVEVHRAPSADQTDEMCAFVERMSTPAQGRPLSDHLWLDLRSGGSPGFIAITVADETGPIAFAQASAANGGSTLEAFTAFGLADRRAVLDDAVETALDASRAFGTHTVHWWIDEPDDDDRRSADRLGFRLVRTLYEMRRSLPVDVPLLIDTRAYVPGDDDEQWLDVNNRAFAGHGEQGGWTRELLALRLAESWFDPASFRIHEVDGRIAGFCWTKLHAELDPVVGEIYVIGVDPDFQGLGLGKQLTLAGLEAIAARGVTHANLYVDADNHAAVALYDRLGFTIHRTRQAFAATL